MKKIIYPKLTHFIDLGFVRIGGPGLANSMIISARSYIQAKKEDLNLINPTWTKISIGPYVRREQDKRHYFGLFDPVGYSGFKKIWHLILMNIYLNKKIKVSGLGNYFEELNEDYVLAKEFFTKIIKKSTITEIESVDFKKIIGVHVRLGDYRDTIHETKISYYIDLISTIKSLREDEYNFYIFSDASNDELAEILSIDGVEKVFFGNALADLVALSKTKLIIGSNSTFSGMASFLNRTPIILPSSHFGSILNEQAKELIINDTLNTECINNFLTKII